MRFFKLKWTINYSNDNNWIYRQVRLQLIFGLLTTFCYLKAAFTNPSQTRNTENYPTNTNNTHLHSLDSINYPSFCEICKQPKHERSSHCRECDKCILRRDHHCIWIGNCVGHHNLKPFINFVFWANVGLINYFRHLYYFLTANSLEVKKYPKLDFLDYMILLIYSVIFLILLNTVFSILCLQFFYLYNDITFYETTKVFGIETYNCFYSKDNTESVHNPYNKGPINNIKNLIGNWINIIVPFDFSLRYKTKSLLPPDTNPTFTKISQPHPYQIHSHLINIDYPNLSSFKTQESFHENPDTLITFSKQNYSISNVIY